MPEDEGGTGTHEAVPSRPALASPPTVDCEAKQLIVTMTLPVLPESPASMLLDPMSAAAGEPVRIDCEPRSAPAKRLAASIIDVPPGRYLLMVEIEGARTRLDLNDGHYTGPVVELPGAERMTHQAGCLCGQVRIAIDGQPVRARTCWCRDCQYWGGGNGTTNALYRIEQIDITGEVTWYEKVADSGNLLRRGFCPSCGTPLFTGPARDPAFLGVRAGAFDDPGAIRPTEVIWTASAPSWACLDPDLPHADHQPPPIA